MNDFADVLVNLARKSVAVEEPGDFRRDGLLFCGKCGSAKQCRVDFDGVSVIVGCMCQCAETEYQAQRERQRQQEKALRVRELRVQGIQDRAVREYTFRRAEASPQITKCRKYAERWPEMLENHTGLLLCGSVGTGKTFAAACIANALIDQCVPVLVTSFPKILNSGWEKAEITSQMKNFPLLVLDDLGAERDSEYALEIVQMVIDERYKTNLPLIVTTNLSQEEMKNPKDIGYRRIYDRVLEMCVPIHFGGASRREKKSAEKLQFAREVLG